MDSNMGANTFERMRLTWPQLTLPSLYLLRKGMQDLSGLSTRFYDVCPNSCMCFAGPHAKLERCIYCNTGRYRFRGGRRVPAKRFQYIPLIPQLKARYAGRESSQAMLYRAENQDRNTNDPNGTIDNIYDSALYRALRKTNVRLDDRILPYTFFNDPRDVLLIILTDGFQVFKRGKHTSWPLIFLNGNLSPETRYSVNTVLSCGVILGPKKPKDFDSFLYCLVEEVVKAALGVPAYDAFRDEGFTLRFYVIYGAGDMPAAAAALLGSKCPGSMVPCRGCPICGVRIPGTKNNSYYIPITRPPDMDPSGYTHDSPPPFRTHKQWMDAVNYINAAEYQQERKNRSRDTGIVSLAITSFMPGVRFPISFPYDLMHLLENTISNYVLLFCGNFKGLDSGSEDYVLSEAVWKEIGETTTAANKLIPSQFGRSIPNIADDRSFFTAEAYLVWATLYAPILLRNRFAHQKYYDHFMLFISIINSCLQLSTTRADREKLRRDISMWYAQYEK